MRERSSSGEDAGPVAARVGFVVGVEELLWLVGEEGTRCERFCC